MGTQRRVPGRDPPGPGRAERPLHDHVVELVRQAILDFELKPGQRLVERDLVERLGVSRPTVREVLRRLSAEGLVHAVPQKGAVVTIPNAADAADIYDMRAALEVLAVRRFVERAGPDQVAHLREAFGELEETFLGGFAGHPHALLRAKDRFNRALMSGVDSPVLEQMLGSLQARVRVLGAKSLSAPGRPAESVAEIRAIVTAIEAGDAERAAEACAFHIRRACRTGMAQLLTLQDA